MQTTRLLRLLDAELLDAEEDIRDLELTLSRRFASMEITPYVYQENSAVLEWELHGLARVRSVLHAVQPSEYAETTDLVAAIHEMLRDQVDHHGMPGAVESIVRRRLTRLLPLVAEGCE